MTEPTRAPTNAEAEEETRLRGGRDAEEPAETEVGAEAARRPAARRVATGE
jgi:hypothetical protein